MEVAVNVLGPHESEGPLSETNEIKRSKQQKKLPNPNFSLITLK